MRTKVMNYIAAFVLGGSASLASASPISPVEYHASNLTWLALSETAGLSISDILNGVNGWNQRYRFATDAEVQSLLNSFGLVPGFRYQFDSPEAAFIWALGGSMPSGTAGTWFFDGSQGATGRTSDMLIDVGLVDIDQASLFGCSQACQYLSITYSPQSVVARSSSVGNFLVEVPEPSSIALLTIATLALSQARRKTRS